MLHILRNKAQSFIIQVIVGIIALVFIFWGVGANLSGSRQTAILVNDQEITFQEYQRAYNAAYEQMSARFGGSIPKGLEEALNIKQQVINRLVQESLVRQGATAMGLVVSDEEIRKSIQEMPQFQENGAFSMEQYEKVLAANNRSHHKFEEQMKVDYFLQFAMREVSGFAERVSNFEVNDIYSAINEKVAVNFLRFSPADFADKVTIEEKKLAEWYETAKEKYKSMPEKKFRYITFSYQDMADKVQVDDAAIEEYYTKHPEEFTVASEDATQEGTVQPLADVQPKIVEILKLKEAKALAFTLASDAYEGIINAGSLDKYIAAQKGNDAVSFQDSGFVTIKTAPAVIADDGVFLQSSFALKKKELSSLIKGKSGYGVFYLDDVHDAVIPKLASVRKQAEEDYRKAQSAELAKKAANDFRVKAEKADDFAQLAQQSGYSVYDSGLLDRQGKSASEKADKKDGETFPASLTQYCFQLSKGKPLSEKAVEADGSFYLLHFAKRELPTMPNDDAEQKAFYQSSLLKMKQTQLFSAWVQHLQRAADVRQHESL